LQREESGEYLKALLEDLAARGIAVSSLRRRYILSFCNEPEKPRGSIKSALATKLTLWANPLIDRATARNDCDLRRFRREPMSLCIAIAPDDLQRLAPLVRLLIEPKKNGPTSFDGPKMQKPRRGRGFFTRWRAPGDRVYWETTLAALGPFGPCSTS
jgi:hypothetical protein